MTTYLGSTFWVVAYGRFDCILRPTSNDVNLKEMIPLVNNVSMPNLKCLYESKTYPIVDCHFFRFQIVHYYKCILHNESSEMEYLRKWLFANHIWLNVRCFALRNWDLSELRHSSSLWWFARRRRPNEAGQSLESFLRCSDVVSTMSRVWRVSYFMLSRYIITLARGIDFLLNLSSKETPQCVYYILKPFSSKLFVNTWN